MDSLLSEKNAIVGVIDPDATAAGDVSSGWVDMSVFGSIMAIAQAGTLGASATFDAKLEQATDSGGTGVKDITGKAITQLTQAGADDSDKQAVINCRASELDLDNAFTHVRLTISVGTATSDAGGLIIGESFHKPASDHDAASVAEIV